MKKTWWKEAVMYQIYPRSFKDSDGDGIGDLRGIIEKLDYLAQLGVDVLWLSPIFQSPNDDNGYDISDYRDIMTEFGTMADFDELLEKAHAKGLKIILDLVVNHSSDEHPWFQASRASKDNPYRDYYIWRPEPPVKWPSFFGGDAWEYDPATGEYYLHLFTKKQPDLNWENPRLRQEVYDLMRFWLDKGIDGFRMDVIPVISKRLDFPPARENFLDTIKYVYANGPRVHEYLQEMNREVLSRYDIMSVGECVGVTTENCMDYVSEDRHELQMLYHFDLLFMNHGPEGKYDPIPIKLSNIKKVIAEWHKTLDTKGWVNHCLDNHDFPRMVSQFGNDAEYRVPSAKLLGTLLLSLRGTPCIYQGDEFGMTNVKYESLDDYDDVELKNTIKEWKEKGKDLDQLLKATHINGRDNARTPVQWDDSPNAGFTTGTPWIKVNPNYREINAKQALADPDSIFYYFQKMIQIRKSNPTLVYGDMTIYDLENEQHFVFRRMDEAGEFLVMLNFSDHPLSMASLPDCPAAELLICNYPTPEKDHLKPWESRIYKIR
ncbi:MAG: alpha-glucosidase [Bacteroidetes bacterium]|nr:MAG: alpha-glucosidase [Bacteroidota bacterium]